MNLEKPVSGVNDGDKISKSKVQTENLVAVSEGLQRLTVRVEDPAHIRRQSEEECAQDQS